MSPLQHELETSDSETVTILLNRTTKLLTDGADLVAHGIADELVGRVVHDEHLVHAELLAGWYGANKVRVQAAVERDSLPP